MRCVIFYTAVVEGRAAGGRVSGNDTENISLWELGRFLSGGEGVRMLVTVPLQNGGRVRRC